MNFVALLLVSSGMFMVGRIYLPWVGPPDDAVMGRSRIPFRARVRLQRANVYGIEVILLLGVIGGWLNPLVELLVMGMVMVILLVPVHYTFTRSGIALGRTPLRHWSEFADVEVRPGCAHLRGADGWRDMRVWLPGSAEDARVVALLRRAIQGADSDPEAASPGATRKSRAAVRRVARGPGRSWGTVQIDTRRARSA